MKRIGASLTTILLALTLTACGEKPDTAETQAKACDIILNPTAHSGDMTKTADELEQYSKDLGGAPIAALLKTMADGMRDEDSALVNSAAETAAEICSPETATPKEPAEETPETAKETSDDSTPILTEDQALTALASISSDATSEQWRSIAQGVCDEYAKEAKPLDEDGDISIRVAETISSSELFHGTGETAASFPGAELQPGQLGMLLLGSTELKCPEWTKDSKVYGAKVLNEG